MELYYVSNRLEKIIYLKNQGFNTSINFCLNFWRISADGYPRIRILIQNLSADTDGYGYKTGGHGYLKLASVDKPAFF